MPPGGGSARVAVARNFAPAGLLGWLSRGDPGSTSVAVVKHADPWWTGLARERRDLLAHLTAHGCGVVLAGRVGHSRNE